MIYFYFFPVLPPAFGVPTLEFNHAHVCLTIRGRNVLLMPIDDVKKSRTT